MIITKKYLQKLREELFLNISKEQEKLILERFGKDPEPDEDGNVNEYTEQDLSLIHI